MVLGWSGSGVDDRARPAMASFAMNNYACKHTPTYLKKRKIQDIRQDIRYELSHLEVSPIIVLQILAVLRIHCIHLSV